VKIIKQGRLPVKESGRGECKNCGCEIELTSAEMDGEESKTEVCPTCRHAIWVQTPTAKVKNAQATDPWKTRRIV
jgi:uncharacterized protein with PIN domain